MSDNPRTPPHSAEAERALIGGVLARGHRYGEVTHAVAASDFYRPFNARVWETCGELSALGEAIDTVTVADRMAVGAEPDEAQVIRAEVLKLAAAWPGAELETYARRVAAAADLRRVVAACQDSLTAAYAADPADAAEVIADIERTIYGAVEPSRRRGNDTYVAAEVYATDAAAETLARWDAYDAGLADPDDPTGIPTGMPDIDRHLGGLQRGALLLIGGRPAMGKSLFAASLAAGAADRGYRVDLFSLEMGAREMALRDLSAASGVTHQKLSRGHGHAEERRMLDRGMAKVRVRPMGYDTNAYTTLSHIRSRALRTIATHGRLDVIIVDYIQLMAPDRDRRGRTAESRAREVSEISEGLKRLARELDVAVVACVQLNRGVEQRTNKRPVLSDLRESGSLEQDADIVVFLYRDEMYDTMTSEPGIAEVIVSKFRNGKTTTIKMGFDGARMMFYPLETHRDPPQNGRPLSVVR